MIAAAGRSVDVPLLRRTIFPCRTAEDGTGLPVARPTGKASWTAIARRPESGRILQQDPQLNPGRAGGRRAGDRHRGMRTPSRILSGRARRSEAMDDREPRPGIREQGRRLAKTDVQRRVGYFWCWSPAAARSHPRVVEKARHASGWACYAAGVGDWGVGQPCHPRLARSGIAPTSSRQELSPGADR
jgi:hypothetical protein